MEDKTIIKLKVESTEEKKIEEEESYSKRQEKRTATLENREQVQ